KGYLKIPHCPRLRNARRGMYTHPNALQGAIDGELALPGLEELPSMRCESRRALEKQLCNHASCAEHVQRLVYHPSSFPTLSHIAIAVPTESGVGDDTCDGRRPTTTTMKGRGESPGLQLGIVVFGGTARTWSLLGTAAIAFCTKGATSLIFQPPLRAGKFPS
ncbi:hypothetical protein FIBSPDRAFT_859783, partial [Athelia psychrophila]